MKITNIRFYNGAREKICRLGISTLFLEVQEIILNAKIYLLEEKDANGAAVVRKKIDEEFQNIGGWEQQKTGGIDWKKKSKYNLSIIVRLGVEIQVSARSDLLVRDIVHLRNSLQKGEIDVGVIIVPDDRLQEFLPDRTPSFKDAVRYIEEEFSEATTYPIAVISVEHDGAGPPLSKQKRKS
jgi:hypothetical protein